MLKAVEVSRQVPESKSSLSILQHPFGTEMKFSPSDDAINHVDTQSGKLQYITRADGGSSGAPCFNADWQLSAIRHAERRLRFGTTRDGILIDHILKEIENSLDEDVLKWN